jgi:hypothetical protein
MSVSGVSSSSSLSQSVQTWQVKAQKIQSEFQQLGQDLQAGNLTQAQSDFSALNQNISGSVQSNSSLTQVFSALGSALQSGNLAAAQKAYSTLQQDVQQTGQTHHHHHHSGGVHRPLTPRRAARFRNCSGAWDQRSNPEVYRPRRRPIRRSPRTYSK